MNLLRYLRRLQSKALRGAIRICSTHRQTLAEGFRLGIGARLGIALAAVGALTLALNFGVEKVFLIERTKHITQIASPSVSGTRGLLPAPAPSRVTSGRLPLTLDHFDSAVRARVAAESELSRA